MAMNRFIICTARFSGIVIPNISTNNHTEKGKEQWYRKFVFIYIFVLQSRDARMALYGVVRVKLGFTRPTFNDNLEYVSICRRAHTLRGQTRENQFSNENSLFRATRTIRYRKTLSSGILGDVYVYVRRNWMLRIQSWGDTCKRVKCMESYPCK